MHQNLLKRRRWNSQTDHGESNHQILQQLLDKISERNSNHSNKKTPPAQILQNKNCENDARSVRWMENSNTLV